MSSEAHCPQCIFVSHQLGRPMPCLLHVASLCDEGTPAVDLQEVVQSLEPDYDEPYLFGQVHPTVDRPGPFSLREYVRLQLLRSRIQANPSRLDRPGSRTQSRGLSRR